jgi:hypothetical protein
VITALAFVPSTPLLVPAVAAGAAGELDGLRSACDLAVRRALSGAPARVVLVGAGAETRELGSGTGSLHGIGVELEVPLDPALRGVASLPLSLTLGAWLLARIGWPGDRAAIEVAADAEQAELDEMAAALAGDTVRTALLVVADGSASRTEKAPASMHPDAGAFDRAVADALAAGDPALLAAIDRDRAAAVSSAGWPAWHVAACAAAGSAYDAELHADEAPYGVGYLAASWLR